MKNEISISKELAYKCALSLVDKHNSIPHDEAHDSVIIVSFRSLYKELCALGQEHLIATATRPANRKNLPLFEYQ